MPEMLDFNDHGLKEPIRALWALHLGVSAVVGAPSPCRLNGSRSGAFPLCFWMELDSIKQTRLRSIWDDVQAGLRGTPRDFTSGSIYRAILVLAVPMVLEMAMQSVFEVADIYFVGRLGPDPVAAVGITASLVILVFAVGLGLAMAGSAMVARRIGEGDPESAAHAAGQAITAALIVSIPIGLLGIWYAQDLLLLMGATREVADVGRGYAAWIFGGNATIILLFLINAVFRGAGDPSAAMRALWLANILNIALDPILIFGWGPVPAMGVTGAAIATTVGRGLGVAYQLWILFRGTGHIRLALRHFNPAWDLTRRLAKVAGPGALQYFIGTASWMALMRLVAEFGSAATAGYTIAIRVIVFALLPAWGISNAAATMVGQNLGARRPDRSEKAVWICSGVAAVFLGFFAAGMLIWSRPIVSLFTSDPAVIAVGAQCVLIIGIAFPLWAVGMTAIQAFNGAGDTRTPTWINFLVFWVVQLPLAWFLAQSLGMEAKGVFVAISISEALSAVVALVWFRAGRWKQTVL